MRCVVVLLLIQALAGCSSLIIRDDDSTATVAGKVMVRVLVAVPTVGISEGILVDLKDEERNRAWRRQELLPSKDACLREWRSYVEDRSLRRIPDRLAGAVLSATGLDYVGGALSAMQLTGVLPDPDDLKAEWRRTLAHEPQAALLSECSQRFALQRFLPAP